MKFLAREPAPHEPSLAEAVSWVGRNLTLAVGLGMELIGIADNYENLQIMEKGVGWLAIAGICEVVRRAEQSAREPMARLSDYGH